MDRDRDRTSAFDRLFSAASRARHELNTNPEELLSATRRLFRRRPTRQGSLGRRANTLWQARLFLLPGPNFDKLPSTTDLLQFAKQGLGQPALESSVGGDGSKIDLTWTLSDLNNFICQSYPLISLNLTGFELARVGKRRKLQKLQAGSVRELKKSVGKSRLYILPRVEIMQSSSTPEIPHATMATPSTSETLHMSDENIVPHQDAIPESSFPPYMSYSTTEPGQSHAVLISQSLQESRTLRSEQDEEYQRSLFADREMEIRRQALENIEERRRMVIRERRHRLADREEPKDGISLKFKFPDGSVKIGKFNESDPVQVLFDFIGQAEEASEIFKLQEATSCTPIESTTSGVISEQGFRTNSTLYVLWMSSMDVEEWISNHMDTEQPQITMPSSDLLWNLHGRPPSSPIPDLAQIPILVDDDDSEVPVFPVLQTADTAFSLSSEEESMNEINLQTILTKLVSGVNFNMCPTSNQINVCRNNILKGSLKAFQRRRFNPGAKLDVVFVDEDMNAEGAVDEGGPTREFLRLLMKAIHGCCIFEGHEKDRQLALSTEALETKMYLFVARMISVCIIHGGVGPHFFSQRLYQQICGLPTDPVKVNDINDHKLREQLMKIQEAGTIEEANMAIQEAADSLSIIGSLRHVSKMEDKDSLVRSAVEFFMNGRMRDASGQFLDGFKTLGLLEELQKNPAVFHNMFVCEEKPLTARDLSSLFGVAFSVQGSNRRSRENQSICFWRDWLIDVEEEEAGPITLETVLEFTSGASAIPPLGFPNQPQIHFLHDHQKIYPEANTCVVALYLPMHSSYEAFKKHMLEGILQAPTFGVA